MAKELTTESYIQHHLTNLTCGKTPEGWTCDPYKVDQMGLIHHIQYVYALEQSKIEWLISKGVSY